MIALESLARCFQGLIPGWLCTCSKDGVPNAAILSHVDFVDSRHIALSYQFFNKSKRNIVENPKALVRLFDPDTFQVYELRLRFVRTETEGALFESMRLRIEAIASHSGLKGIFKLLGADVYEVISVAAVPHEIGRRCGAADRAREERAGVPFTLRAMQELSDRIQRAPTLDRLLDEILEALERTFGFRHSMILLASDEPERLQTIASRGYPAGGVGSEVGFGDGIIGMVAESRKPVRISGMLRQMLYANAVAERAKEHGECPEERRIPLPGLASPDSQLGIPLLARDELVGVLCIEADEPYRFHEADREYLEVLGGFLAIAIENARLREREEAAEPAATGGRAEGGKPGRAARGKASPATGGGGARIGVEYYASDECILVDGEYLIRGLPAKILRKLLIEHAQGQVEFTNRRLRLDKTLELPAWKDNLESRLILLRRRLEERCPPIRIVPAGRGRFRLEVRGEIAFAERP